MEVINPLNKQFIVNGMNIEADYAADEGLNNKNIVCLMLDISYVKERVLEDFSDISKRMGLYRNDEDHGTSRVALVLYKRG